MSSASAAVSDRPIIYLGMDAHKDSITICQPPIETSPFFHQWSCPLGARVRAPPRFQMRVAASGAG